MNKTTRKIATVLLKDFSIHTATSLSKELKLSRQGTWKILKKLEKEGIIVLEQIGSGKTSAQTVRLNWDNELAEKTLPFSWSRRHCSTKDGGLILQSLSRKLIF
mgnify:CR=1 FL=1